LVKVEEMVAAGQSSLVFKRLTACDVGILKVPLTFPPALVARVMELEAVCTMQLPKFPQVQAGTPGSEDPPSEHVRSRPPASQDRPIS
jgi:hypothetical protein